MKSRLNYWQVTCLFSANQFSTTAETKLNNASLWCLLPSFCAGNASWGGFFLSVRINTDWKSWKVIANKLNTTSAAEKRGWIMNDVICRRGSWIENLSFFAFSWRGKNLAVASGIFAQDAALDMYDSFKTSDVLCGTIGSDVFPRANLQEVENIWVKMNETDTLTKQERAAVASLCLLFHRFNGHWNWGLQQLQCSAVPNVHSKLS